jgi:hypothetical protein
MNNKTKHNAIRWFPGRPAIYDRWGEPVNATFAAREFAPRAEAPEAVVNRLRWCLGLM